MSIVSMIVVYILLWWVCLFMILPIGIKGQAEVGDIVPGSEPGAPAKLSIKRKFLHTTIVATLVWGVVCVIIWAGLIDPTWFDWNVRPE